jgi:hypothetical protein
MNLKASLAVLALALLQTAHAGSLRASQGSASLELAAGSAALARASAAADAQARRLQEGAAGMGDVKGALDAISTSIDIFNKISAVVIDTKAVDDATAFITANQGEMVQYGSDSVTASLQQLAACGVAQSQTAQRITGLTMALSKSSASTQALLAHVNASTGELDASSRMALSAALSQLSSMLSVAVTQSNAAAVAFEALESQATLLQTTLAGAALHFKTEQDAASRTLSQARDEVREEAYGSCAAICVATFGLGCAPCFAAAVPIVEAKIIPDLQAKLEAFSQRMDGFQRAFAAVGSVATGYASSAKSSGAALGDYVSVVSSAASFVGATSDLDIALALVDDYRSQLRDISAAAALLLAKIQNA